MNKNRFTLGELIITIFILVIIAGMIIPVISKAQQNRANRASRCWSNLKQIGLALLMYSGDENGFFPITLSGNNFEPLNQLEIINDSKVFGCPYAEDLKTTARNSNYRYGGSGLRDDNTGATTTTLASDQSVNHPDNEWINALFVDGHVEGSKPDGKQTWNSF